MIHAFLILNMSTLSHPETRRRHTWKVLKRAARIHGIQTETKNRGFLLKNLQRYLALSICFVSWDSAIYIYVQVICIYRYVYLMNLEWFHLELLVDFGETKQRTGCRVSVQNSCRFRSWNICKIRFSWPFNKPSPKKSHIKIWWNMQIPSSNISNGRYIFKWVAFLHCHISFRGCTWKDYLILFQEEQKQPCVVGTTQFKKKNDFCLQMSAVIQRHDWIQLDFNGYIKKDLPITSPHMSRLNVLCLRNEAKHFVQNRKAYPLVN